jgi:hypothetical protein
MKLKCTCGKTLTKDVCLKSYKQLYSFEKEERQIKHKRGFFSIRNKSSSYNNKWSDEHPAQIIKPSPKYIIVSEDDVILTIIPMPPGHGCCNWSGGPLFCECGSEIATMNIDCYEEKSIYFYDKKVVRMY